MAVSVLTEWYRALGGADVDRFPALFTAMALIIEPQIRGYPPMATQLEPPVGSSIVTKKLTSPQARETLDREGIAVIDYRPLQQAWNA